MLKPSRVMKEQRGLAHSFTLDCFSPTLDDDVQAIVTDEQILYPFSQNPDKTISHQQYFSSPLFLKRLITSYTRMVVKVRN
ncbi:hypothetical protein PSTT_04867 [Puccinia striiformis]|uniref:Uncharacterized protein n=1 Tax=Puccinia striiformis TaxID=27350 RepID=A0A2S4VR94_9BASI|nr:hypothetical protein PSTT_04867 [Puccinia striiformis]